MTQRIRVLHVLPWVSSGGVEKRRVQIVAGLDPERFEHRVVCQTATPLWKPHLEAAGAEVHEIGGTWDVFDLESIARVVSIVEAWRPQIIHGAVFEGVVMAAIAGYLARVPWVLIEETGAGVQRRVTGDVLMSAMALLSHRCISISRYAAQFLRDRSKIPDHKICVVTNGVRFPELLSPAQRLLERDALGFAPDDFVVGSVGRVHDHHKRFTDLIDAVAASPPRVKLLIVGDGPDMGLLRERVREKGVQGRVVLAGRRSDVGAMYSVMDCFALASAIEPFGLVLVEAMSAGLPVVATRVGGIPDIVLDGQTGALVERYDVPGLSAQFTRMMESPELCSQLGERGRERASMHFSETRYLQDLVSLYEGLLAERV